MQYPDHLSASTATLADQRPVGVFVGDGVQYRVTVIPADPRFSMQHGEQAFRGTGARFTGRSRKQVADRDWLVLHGTVNVQLTPAQQAQLRAVQGASPAGKSGAGQSTQSVTNEICWCVSQVGEQLYLVLLNAASRESLKEGEESLPEMMATLKAAPPKPAAIVTCTSPRGDLRFEHLDTLRERQGTQGVLRSVTFLEGSGLRITVGISPALPRFELAHGEMVFRKGEVKVEQRQIVHHGTRDWLLLRGRNSSGNKVCLCVCDDVTQIGVVLLSSADEVGYQLGEKALPRILQSFGTERKAGLEPTTWQGDVFSIRHPRYMASRSQRLPGMQGCVLLEANGHWVVVGVQPPVLHFNKRHPEKVFRGTGATFERRETLKVGEQTWTLLHGHSKSGESICWGVSNDDQHLRLVLLSSVSASAHAVGLQELPGLMASLMLR